MEASGSSAPVGPAPPSAYDESARERWVTEPPKRASRTAFERDRARVLHSAALRRLAAKTQVHGPGTDDFVRNRLTHSLEVAQVGREVGKELGCDPDVVDTACLAHDLGHPPFGHNGELALDVFAAPCGGFEGNAQTLRILTRLEAKAFARDGRPVGLNLTRASLDAVSKYPWPRTDATPIVSPGAAGATGPPLKFGVYVEDAEVFGWMRSGTPSGRRCLEAQVMDFADDVAYSVHDVEDGIQAGQVVLAMIAEPSERAGIAETVRTLYVPNAEEAAVAAAMDRLAALPCWPVGHDGSRAALARLKNMASQLIGRFCAAVEDATRSAYGAGPLVRYGADLLIPEQTRLEIGVLKGIAARYVMFTADREAGLEAERELVAELAELVLLGAPETLEPSLRADWADAADDVARRRVVVDQVASLTDPSARELHAQLRAQPWVR